jgi:thiol-disulfide isomerase/thioredoxin
MNKSHSFLILSFLIVFASMATNRSCTAQTTQQKQIWAKSFLGQKAPPIVVEGWINKPANTKGKYVLVDIWATGCNSCKKLVPELNYWQKEFKGQLIIIGISTESKEKVQPFTEENIEYASGYDTQARMKYALKVTGIPHVIIINPEGIVIWEGYPGLPEDKLTSEVIEKLIK